MADKKPLKKRNIKFKAEVNQLLDILTHSLYTHRDIFIRELISNSADALDKARLKDVMGEKIINSELDFEIRITLNQEEKTFTIQDTGIGMTSEEIVQNIGTIARSGTSEFLKQLQDQNKDNINLIGRFGIGFYSVFMAAKKVEITSRSAISKFKACRWISDGAHSFQVEEIDETPNRGSVIKVYLRDDAHEFAEEFTVKNAIEKYSNFVPFPIYVNDEKVNKITAIWREPKSNIKKKSYQEFFKFIAKQNDDPLNWLHFSADVPLQFHSLLFVPKTNLERLGFGQEDEGIHLFVKRVMVDPHAKDILPPYLRFVKGVIESDDLPLNISRETLQENPYLIKIKNSVTAKFLSHLESWAKKDEKAYMEFWNEHGRILKEGYNDYTHKDQVAALLRYYSSKSSKEDQMISLETYTTRMRENQDDIYFLSGPTQESVEQNPLVEIFRKKDIEVLFCLDPIDEFALPGLIEFKGHKIISADQADLSKLEKIQSTESDKEKSISVEKRKAFEKLARRIKNILGDRIEDASLSERLVGSPAVLVSSSKVMSSQMEKIMQMMNKDAKPLPKILEINPRHSLIKDMLLMYEKNPKDVMLTRIVNSLFSTVSILDGIVNEPQAVVKDIQDMMTQTAKIYSKSLQSK